MASHLSQQDFPAAHLTVKLIERFIDGSIRMEGVELDGEKDREHLAALLGANAAKVNSSPDARTLADLVKAFFEDGDRSKRWTAKTRSELEAICSLLTEAIGADKALAELNRKDFAYFKEMLTKLPSNRSKDVPPRALKLE